MGKKKILIVEDERIVAKDIHNRLRSFGYEVCGMVSTGEEAVKVAGAALPDLVLMDIMLGGRMDGVETAEYIRRDFGIPVVFLTAYADDSTLQRAKITEPFGYIIKPFEERELHSTIQIALYKHTADKKIRESEKRYRDLFDSSLDCIYQTNADGVFTLINSAGARILGHSSPEELIGKSSLDYWLMPDDRRIFLGELQNTLSLSAYPILAKRNDGKIINLEITAHLIHGKKGGFIGVEGILRDVSDRVRADEEIKTRARQQEEIALLGQKALSWIALPDFMKEAVMAVTRTMGLEFCEILELSESEDSLVLRCAAGWKEDLSVDESVNAEPMSQAGYALVTRTPVVVEDARNETRFIYPSRFAEQGIESGVSVVIGGRDRPFGVLAAHTSSMRKFSKDEINFLQSVSHVLSQFIERKRAEEVIFQITQDWEDTFNAITDMITVHDRDFNIIRANKAAEEILGLPFMEDVTKSKCFKFYHGLEGAPAGCPSCGCLVTGESSIFEFYEPHLKMFLELRAIPRLDAEGRVTGLIHVVRNITERKKIEDELNRLLTDITKAKNEWEKTFDSATELIVLVDMSHRMIRWNRSFADYFEIPITGPGGRFAFDFLPYRPEKISYCKDGSKTDEEAPRFEVETATGQWFYLSFCPIIEDGEQGSKMVITATDITVLKKTQQQLQLSERELTKRVQDLEKFYRMAVDRELRMRDMKKEIQRLTSELTSAKDGLQAAHGDINGS